MIATEGAGVGPSPERVNLGYADTEAGQVHFRSAGDPGTAETLVVLLHQTPLSSVHLAPLLPELVGPGVAAVAFDTPGYGGSPRPDTEWSIERYAEVLWSAVDDIARPVEVLLVGRATGTVVAVAMARLRPESVRRIALYGLPLYTDEERRERLEGDFAAPFVPTLDGAHHVQLRERILGQYPQLTAAELDVHLLEHLLTGGDFGSAYRAMWRYDLRANVAALELPILLLGGTHDRVRPYFDRAVEHLPDAEHVELDGADDFLAERDPHRLAEVLRPFLGI